MSALRFLERGPRGRRRLGQATIALTGGVLAAALVLAPHARVMGARLSGWALLVALLLLAAYGLRKRLAFLRLGRSGSWRVLHLWLGCGALLVFLAHAGGPPAGAFRLFLWLAFLGVALSGLVGWILSRVLPRSLAGLEEEVVFERLGEARDELRRRAQELALTHPESELARLYPRRLHRFLSGPRDTWAHLRRVPGEAERVLSELEDHARRVGAAEAHTAEALAALVRRKRDLDRHSAQQGALKLWLWVHLPLTGVTFLAVALHVLVVHAFGRQS